MQSYDYIVVGAGSAGAVVANRLSANPRHKVLLLKAGPVGHFWSRIPVGYAKLINNPAANWLDTSEPEANTGGRCIPVPRGRILGGSNSINGLAFVRGQAQDFDSWAQMGYAALIEAADQQGVELCRCPALLQADGELEGGDDAFRGREGPLRVTDPPPREPLYKHNPDYNGAIRTVSR